MKRMIKLPLWILIPVLGILIGSFLMLVPKSPIKDLEKLEINQVIRVDDGKEIDISDQMDQDTLKTLLLMIQCDRLPSHSGPSLMEDHRYEINGMYDRKPIHFLFGTPKISSIYGSATSGLYRIKDSNAWVLIMDSLYKTGNE